MEAFRFAIFANRQFEIFLPNVKVEAVIYEQNRQRNFELVMIFEDIINAIDAMYGYDEHVAWTELTDHSFSDSPPHDEFQNVGEDASVISAIPKRFKFRPSF